MNINKDYYHIVGVRKDAPLEAIKKKLDTKISAYHPRHNTDRDSETEATYQELLETRSVLLNPESKTKYDFLRRTMEISKIRSNYFYSDSG